MMSREQAQALTRAIHLLRPAWNEEGIFAALGHVKERDPFDIALAALRAAADEKVRTPGVIPTTGPHWNEAAPKEPVRPRSGPPRKSETCPVHPGSWADNCSGCRADQLAGDQTTGPNLRRPDVSDRVAQVRAEIRAKGVSA